MLVLVVAAFSGAVTLAAALFPQLEFVNSAPALHVAFETAGGLIALLAGFLIGVRFLRRARLTELTLACSLGVLALTELAFATVPVSEGRGSTGLSVWAAMGGRVLCAVLFAVAVFLPDRRLRRPRLDLALGAGAVTVTPLLIAGAAVVFAPSLPGVTVAAAGLPLPAQADLHADAVLIRSELALTMIYCLAAAGFLRRAERFRDEFSGWLAAAAVLAAASHINYFLYPVMYSPLVSLGDVFRLCSCAVLLAGSSREISTYWLTSPDAAALEERRRIARDLRDGLAQDLAYLLGNLDSLDGAVGTEMRAHLRRAAERAQTEARLAIVRLAGTPAEPVNGTAAGVAAGRRWRLRLTGTPAEPVNGTAAGVAAGRRWRLRLPPVAPRLVSIRPRNAAEDSGFSSRDDELAGIGPGEITDGSEYFRRLLAKPDADPPGWNCGEFPGLGESELFGSAFYLSEPFRLVTRPLHRACRSAGSRYRVSVFGSQPPPRGGSTGGAMRSTRPAVPVVAAVWGTVALSAAVVPLLESTNSIPALYVAVATAGPFIALCAYRRAPLGAGVTEERRRIARELHDGPAQELAYLLRHLDALDGTIDAETRENLRTAAERAHRETRLAIKSLSRPRTERAGVTVARAVGEVAARDRIDLELDVARDLLLPAPRAEALVRIACEAVRNAAQHSGSGQVALSVQPVGPRVRLRVSDSGRGFDPAAPHGGFGLASMRERARLAGGELYIHSVPGGGTEVEGTL